MQDKDGLDPRYLNLSVDLLNFCDLTNPGLFCRILNASSRQECKETSEFR